MIGLVRKSAFAGPRKPFSFSFMAVLFSACESTAIIKRFEAQYKRVFSIVSRRIGEEGLSWLIKDARRFIQSSFLPIVIVGDMELRGL